MHRDVPGCAPPGRAPRMNARMVGPRARDSGRSPRRARMTCSGFACPDCGSRTSMEARTPAQRASATCRWTRAPTRACVARAAARVVRSGTSPSTRWPGDPLPYFPLLPLRLAGSSPGMSVSCSSSTAQGSTSTNRRSGGGCTVPASGVAPRFAARFPALARVGLCAATAVPLCPLSAQHSTAPLRRGGPSPSAASDHRRGAAVDERLERPALAVDGVRDDRATPPFARGRGGGLRRESVPRRAAGDRPAAADRARPPQGISYTVSSSPIPRSERGRPAGSSPALPSSREAPGCPTTGPLARMQGEAARPCTRAAMFTVWPK
jgi:hypothetical protein